MTPTNEIPNAAVLRDNTRVCRQELLTFYFKKLSIQAATQLVRCSNEGNTSWLVPRPYDLYDIFGKQVVLRKFEELFGPFGYKIEDQPEPNSYIRIFWED
jgi:hypothetical protein